jgi:tRNA pseudouridine38-40 synthase
LYYTHNINLPLIKKTAKLFIGKHNFKSFSTSELDDTIRIISSITFQKLNNHLTITIKANGFLRNMVRMIVGALLDVNERKKNIEQIKELLNNPEKGSSITKVKGCGLYLYKVNY